MNRQSTFACLLLATASYANAQDVEKEYLSLKDAWKSEPVKLSGTAGFSGTFYQGEGIAARRDPLTSVFNANLNITLLNKINIPFSALLTTKEKIYSNGLERYNHPFKQFGLSPSYKGLTVHAGHRSFQFSEYSLSGTLLLGGGIEFRPTKTLLSALFAYGRLAKAIPAGSPGQATDVSRYERRGGALKIRAGTARQHFEIIAMHISDLPYSLPADSRNRSAPQENLVVSLATLLSLAQLTCDLDLHLSYFSPNLFEPLSKNRQYSYRNQLFNDRPGTRSSRAFHAALQYIGKGWQSGINFKRVDPDYQSLGATYVCNDVEEHSVNAGCQLAGNKIQIQSALGLQRNNLDKIQLSTKKRIITSVNLNFTLRPNWTLQGSYSTLNSKSLQVRDVYGDSLHFLQVSMNAGGTSSYGFGNKNYKAQFQLQTSLQESTNSLLLNKLMNHQSGLQCTFQKTALTFNFNALANSTRSQGNSAVDGFGGLAHFQKGFSKNKFTLSLSTSYLKQSHSGRAISRTLLIGAAFYARLSKILSFRLDYSLQERKGLSQTVKNYKEHRLNFNCQITLNQKIRHAKTSK